MSVSDVNTVDPAIAQMCADAIRKNLGSLADLPPELANTVANVYYRFFQVAGSVQEHTSARPHWLPQATSSGRNLGTSVQAFLQSASSSMAAVDSVKGFVEGLRVIDKGRQPRLYRYTVEFILDCLKYDIPNVCNKSILRRRIERLRRKRQVHEISCLVDKLRL